ncbi:MAG TPA: response regulator [Gaiellaceae bacterium]|nr:response regulator [Gaiellaceae bacterium]
MRQEVSETNGGQQALLVADDHAPTRALVRALVGEAGWSGEILEAASGAGAVALATEGPVVAAVLDVQMPTLDGVKAAEAIWNYCHELPIIFYSSDVPPPPVAQRAPAIRKGQVDDLLAELTALLSGDLDRPRCDPLDAVVLQALLAAHDDNPLMIVDTEGEFKFANCAASHLYNLAFPARGNLFDQGNALAESGASRAADTLPLARALATGLPVHDQVRLAQEDGSVTVARVTAVPHRAVDGQLTSVSLYTRQESIRTS